MFGGYDYRKLHDCVFDLEYPGYKPELIESPHGDGKLDAQKRYAHVALKYRHPSDLIQHTLDGYLMHAHRMALEVAKILEVPEKYTPKLEYSALRVLEYSAGVGGHEHTDFDLFTLNLWRNDGGYNLKARGESYPNGVHMGEIGELVGLGKATSHFVQADTRPQHSLVYFAIPDWGADLPVRTSNERLVRHTVRTWLAERLARSRYATNATQGKIS